MISRRNVLVGLGGLTVGGGALLGTGAFSTAEASREINVELAGDASGFLTITPESDYAQESDGTIQIDLDGSAGTGAATGLNLHAVTTVNPLLEVTNNSNNDIGLYLGAEGDDVTVNDGDEITVGVIDTSDSNADVGSLDLIFEDESSNTIIHSGSPTEGDTEVLELDSGVSEEISIEIDTNNIDGSGDISSYDVQIDNIVFNAEDGLNTS